MDYLYDDYVPRRAEKGIRAYMITPKNPANIKARSDDANILRETRFLPTAKSTLFEIEINIYGNKTAFFSYKPGEQFGVILESRAIVNALMAIFDVCWKISK
jgi:hypothetical protein